MKDKINGRTPEEIKKGLSTCTQSGDCPNCPYETDCKEHAESGDNLWLGEPAMADALAYIQQLERERDAAVELLYDLATNERTFCDSCVYNSNPECCSEQKVINADCWEWRGLEVE